MKHFELYDQIDQEHSRYAEDSGKSTEVEEELSPQEKYIKDKILSQIYLVRNFEIVKSPIMSYSILYALGKHIEKYPTLIPTSLQGKELKEKIRLLRVHLLKYHETFLKESKERKDQFSINEGQRNIRFVRSPVKGIGIDDPSDILLLARFLKVRIYVYQQDAKKWNTVIPTNARVVSTPEGGRLYYYKERVKGNIFLFQNKSHHFDLIYPKVASLAEQEKKKLVLKKIPSLKKKVVVKRPEKKKMKTILPEKHIPLPVIVEQVLSIEKPKRCPKGTRRNKSTGLCEPVEKVDTGKVEKAKRCPKGTRRNKSTGLCEPVEKEDTGKVEKPKRCPKGTRRNKSTGLCEPG